jgi:hypothetical protein
LKLTQIYAPQPVAAPSLALVAMVNLRLAGIFNGILETQKSAQNREKSAKIDA